jgi:hypothetical protein
MFMVIAQGFDAPILRFEVPLIDPAHVELISMHVTIGQNERSVFVKRLV